MFMFMAMFVWQHGWTLLMQVSSVGNLHAVNALLKYNANVDLRNHVSLADLTDL